MRVCCRTDPFCPTNSSAFWILCGVFPMVCLSLMPLCPCKPSKSWALMHRLPCFSTKLTVACRERLHIVCMCVRALVPFLEASLCSLCTNARATEASWVRFSCGWTTCLRILLWLETCLFFFPDIIKKTNSTTVSPSYINRLCLALDSP